MPTPKSTSAFDSWKRWDKKNPAFYDLFKRFSLVAVGCGKTEFSGWLIANRIRWETEVVTQGAEWKVPNGHIAYFTRLFMAEFPKLQVFETRPLKHVLAEGVLEDWLYERVGLLAPPVSYPADGGLKAQVRDPQDCWNAHDALKAQQARRHDQAAFAGRA